VPIHFERSSLILPKDGIDLPNNHIEQKKNFFQEQSIQPMTFDITGSFFATYSRFSLHDFYFFFSQVVEFVNELVDFGFEGGDVGVRGFLFQRQYLFHSLFDFGLLRGPGVHVMALKVEQASRLLSIKRDA
jgi:hypothetical protein